MVFLEDTKAKEKDKIGKLDLVKVKSLQGHHKENEKMHRIKK